MATEKTDILIIGGGIAGCIAAISLIDTYQVTLVDKLHEPTERIGESLAPASQRILKQLNLLEGLENQVDTLYQKNVGMQSYWGSNQVYLLDDLRNPDGFVKNLDRQAFESYLRKVAEARGVHCLWGSKLHSSSYEDSHWQVQLRAGDTSLSTSTISASFVIDASGRQSHFAKSLGIKRQVEDKLVACWVTLPNSRTNTMSTISASENGWWYSAVVPNDKRVVAFHTDADLVVKNELKTTTSFLELAKENPVILSLLNEHENAIVFKGTVAANSTKLEQVAGQQWVALGDAALSFDPLSSQGMYNAMASAMQLQNLVLKYGFTETLQKIHTEQTERIWHHYLNHKSIFYQAETRWKTAAFWERRL
ncbi:tryptophan 7-halogenase [Flavobacterium sp. Fl-318]|uniref:Tryptophan 7-halogenase n=1 Tax=Flavobacterium cupriresistens TaxID=2893885 RepID=A0ABU4RIQ8_9FLAO|nr:MULTISPECIES: tryptophan 7-halogenase [unclassified Flavobacterium]MDX6191634.1 tryptophan 7-halogenase [Flavobacterium sp. Fl-318]UFH41579.1 tryptophan 7-halogenase [Flavobacterium sp. F-323]